LQCKPPVLQRRSLVLPTRLVDCGSLEVPAYRLVLGQSLPAETSYTTLSYCWGTSMPVCLLKSNIDSLMKQIQVDDLPKTLQDVIHVARQLGQRYIWIDSLCIVQDDAEDWEREASTMGNVYSGGYCNICATASADSSSGLFRARLENPQRQLKLHLRVKNQRGWYFVSGKMVWRREVEEAPLNDRAWVCQERFLSRCNLHFGTGQLFWECGELSANEWFPLGISSSLGDSQAATHIKQLASRTLA
jgi:hypothetical protein